MASNQNCEITWKLDENLKTTYEKDSSSMCLIKLLLLRILADNLMNDRYASSCERSTSSLGDYTTKIRKYLLSSSLIFKKTR